MQVAKIAVAAAPYAIDQPYDYQIPIQWAEKIQVGMRVLVPFGRGNRPSEGMVLSLTEEVRRTMKPIRAVLDAEPVLTSAELKLAYWMRERYFCTLYDAFKAILPVGLWYHFHTEYALADESLVPEALQERAEPLLLALRLGKQTGETLQSIDGADCGDFLRQLEQAGVITRSMQAKQRTRDKSVRIVRLTIDPETALSIATPKKNSAPVQYEAIRFLCEHGAVSLQDLQYYTGATYSTLKALEKRELIAYSEQEVFRVPEVVGERSEITLNPAQQRVYDAILPILQENRAELGLLHGVTGSGKTLVFLRLIQEVRKMGKTALVLVPEIALTPQMMQRFTQYLGDDVAVLHSGLRATERYDQYKRIRKGLVSVVLGTRSAVFAPLQNLGLLVIDEEQETTYQSEQMPRYDAREVARFRCAKEGALLLMGSATPSIATMYQVRSGKGKLFQLQERYNQVNLPKVSIVDMRKELRRGNSTLISQPLQEALEQALLRGEQSILFLNRRGNSRLILCGECGHIPQCPRCSVALTYHLVNYRLMCHYCGHSERRIETCPTCGGTMQEVGAGTQKVEELLHSLYPQTKILRMDADTVASAGGHERILQAFVEQKIPILLGTQMVAKGLDFPNVGLVGVLDADLSLYLNHYQAAERTFDLLTQVVGRAGRGQREGRAFLQTFTPENDVIALSAKQDYETFYQTELRLRKQLHSPPFADLFTLTFSGAEEQRVLQAAYAVSQELKQQSRLWGQGEVLGPIAAPILKVNNRYRYHITWVGQNDLPTRRMLSAQLCAFFAKKEYRGLQCFIERNAPS